MPKFKIMASYLKYCELEIEAENIDEAKEIAYNADGGDFTPCDKYGDWNIDSVKEISV
jgi:hypothetical protein